MQVAFNHAIYCCARPAGCSSYGIRHTGAEKWLVRIVVGPPLGRQRAVVGAGARSALGYVRTDQSRLDQMAVHLLLEEAVHGGAPAATTAPAWPAWLARSNTHKIVPGDRRRGERTTSHARSLARARDGPLRVGHAQGTVAVDGLRHARPHLHCAAAGAGDGDLVDTGDRAGRQGLRANRRDASCGQLSGVDNRWPYQHVCYDARRMASRAPDRRAGPSR